MLDKFFVDKNGDVIEFTSDKDRRTHVRFPVNLSVRYCDETSEPCADFIMNISMGGVFIQSETPKPVGCRIRMDFEIPPKIRYLGRFNGEVVAVNADDPKYPKGMFVKFVDAGDEELKMLEDFLEGHRHLLDEEI